MASVVWYYHRAWVTCGFPFGMTTRVLRAVVSACVRCLEPMTNLSYSCSSLLFIIIIMSQYKTLECCPHYGSVNMEVADPR